MRKFISMVLALVMILSCVYINVSANELIASTKVELYQLAPESQSLMESYVIKTDNDKLIVIDGGIDGAGRTLAPYLPAALRAIAGVGEGEYFEVEAWFLSHAHVDHFYELSKMLNEYDENSNYKINNFYFDFPEFGSEEYSGTLGETGDGYLAELKAGLDNYAEVNEIEFDSETYYDEINGAVVNESAISKGLDINIDGVRFEILQTWSAEDGTTEINNTSMIIRMHAAGKTVLFLNDAYIQSGNRLVETYGEDLKSDYVQTAHHGQSGTKQNVYDAVDADFFLWPTPKWIWTNPDSYAIDDVRTWIAGEDYLEVRENDLVAGMYDVYPDDPAVVADWAEALPGMKITFTNEDANYTAPKANKNLKYTGEEQELIAEGSTDIGTMEYCIEGNDYADAIPAAVNAGEYTVYYRITDGENVLVEESISVTIAKAIPEFTAPEAKVLFNTGEEQELIEAGSIAEGEFLYSTDDVDYSAEIPTATESGNYTVYYKVEESENYLEISGSVDVTIGDYKVTFKNGNELAPFDEDALVSVMDGESLASLPYFEAKANTSLAYFKIGDVRFTEEELLSYEVTENTEVLAYFRESAITSCDYDFTTMTEEEFELTVFGMDSDFVLTEGVGIQLSKNTETTYTIPMATDVSESAFSISYGCTGTANTGGFNGHITRGADAVASFYHTANSMVVYGSGATHRFTNVGQVDDGTRHTVEYIIDLENEMQYMIVDGYAGIVPAEGAYSIRGNRKPDLLKIIEKAGGSLIIDSFSIKRFDDAKARKVTLAAGEGVTAVNFLNRTENATYDNSYIYMVEGTKVPVGATMDEETAFSSWEATSGSFSDETAMKAVYTAGSANATVTAEGEAPQISEGDVAKIGRVGYATLQDAINAVGDGQTITLLSDETVTTTLLLNTGNSFTIDGAGFDLIFGMSDKTVNCVYVSADTKVLFKNIDIYRNNTTTNNYGFFYISTGSITLGDGAVLGSTSVQMVQGNGGIIWVQKASTDTGTGKAYFTLNGEGAKIQNVKGSWQKGLFDGSNATEVNLLKGTIENCTHGTAMVGERGNFIVNLGDVTIINSKEPTVNGNSNTTVNITGSGTLGTVKASSAKISFKKSLTYGPSSLTYQGSDFTGSVVFNVTDTTVPASYAKIESGMKVGGDIKSTDGKTFRVDADGNLVMSSFVETGYELEISNTQNNGLYNAVFVVPARDNMEIESVTYVDTFGNTLDGKAATKITPNDDGITMTVTIAGDYTKENGYTDWVDGTYATKYGETHFVFGNTVYNWQAGDIVSPDFFKGIFIREVLGDGAGDHIINVKFADGETLEFNVKTNLQWVELTAPAAVKETEYTDEITPIAGWKTAATTVSNNLTKAFDGYSEYLIKKHAFTDASGNAMSVNNRFETDFISQVVKTASGNATIPSGSKYVSSITQVLLYPALRMDFFVDTIDGLDTSGIRIYPRINSYNENKASGSGRGVPSKIVFWGSNDGENWDNLGTYNFNSTLEEKTALFGKNVRYRYYKGSILEVNGNTYKQTANISELVFIKPETELKSNTALTFDTAEENAIEFTFKTYLEETIESLKDKSGNDAEFTFENDTLTIDATYLKALTDGTYEFTAKFTNGAEFALTIIKTDATEVTYLLADSGEMGRGTNELVLASVSGKEIKKVTYNGGKALSYTASDDNKTIAIARYDFRGGMDLYATMTLEEDGLVPVVVTYSDDTTKTYNVTISSDWVGIPAPHPEATFLSDELKPKAGEWKVRTSSANTAHNHPANLFTGKLYNEKNKNNWHTGYTLVDGAPIADTELDQYIDVDFGANVKPYKGIRITERVSGSRYENITLYGKNSDGEEWTLLYSGSADAVAPSANEILFEEAVNYRYLRMKINGRDNHVTADIMRIINGVEEGQVNIKVTPTTGGNVTVTTGGTTAPSLGDNYVEANTNVTFTATSDESGEFCYWIEASTGKILGKKATLNVNTAIGKDIKAVFASPADTEAFVSFYGIEKGSILATGYVKKNDAPSALVPSAEKLYTTGYAFSKWVDKEGNDIDVDAAVSENTEYYALYSEKSEENKRFSTITVNGGKVVALGSGKAGVTSGTFAYDTVLRATADEPNEGEEFKYWTLEGNIVSYDEKYKFYAPDADITLTAVFGPKEEAVTEKVQIAITETSDVVNGVNVAGFITTRYVPSGVNVIETGVIYVKDASYEGSGEDGKLTVADAGNTSANGKTVKVAFSSKTESGQHKLSASYTDLGIKAVGFITYVEGEGITTLYTDMITVK